MTRCIVTEASQNAGCNQDGEISILRPNVSLVRYSRDGDLEAAP